MNQIRDLEDVISQMADIFFLEIWISPAENKYTCDRFNKWINTVFQIKSKNVGWETEKELSRPSLFFTGLRRRSKLRPTQLKLFSSGGTFRLSWVPQPIESVLMNESWKFEYDTYASFVKLYQKIF